MPRDYPAEGRQSLKLAVWPKKDGGRKWSFWFSETRRPRNVAVSQSNTQCLVNTSHQQITLISMTGAEQGQTATTENYKTNQWAYHIAEQHNNDMSSSSTLTMSSMGSLQTEPTIKNYHDSEFPPNTDTLWAIMYSILCVTLTCFTHLCHIHLLYFMQCIVRFPEVYHETVSNPKWFPW